VNGAAGGDERTGLFVMRAWIEPHHDSALRVRIVRSITVGAGGPAAEMSVHAASVDDVVSNVRSWLESLADYDEGSEAADR
jgi:hypothetical protein